MRIYRDFGEVMSEVKRDLKELAVLYQSETVQDMEVVHDPGYWTHELLNYSYTLLNPMSVTTWPHLNRDYIEQEFKERTDGFVHNPGSAWTHDYDYWSQFLHNGKFAYTYSERMADQLWRVSSTLGTPNTRQAWLPIWWPKDNCFTGGESRVPCSLGYFFMIRENGFHLHYVMRSCDFINHFPKDVCLAVMLGDYMRGDMPFRTFTHTIFSLHAFAKDLEGVF